MPSIYRRHANIAFYPQGYIVRRQIRWLRWRRYGYWGFQWRNRLLLWDRFWKISQYTDCTTNIICFLTKLELCILDHMVVIKFPCGGVLLLRVLLSYVCGCVSYLAPDVSSDGFPRNSSSIMVTGIAVNKSKRILTGKLPIVSTEFPIIECLEPVVMKSPGKGSLRKSVLDSGKIITRCT